MYVAIQVSPPLSAVCAFTYLLFLISFVRNAFTVRCHAGRYSYARQRRYSVSSMLSVDTRVALARSLTYYMSQIRAGRRALQITVILSLRIPGTLSSSRPGHTFEVHGAAFLLYWRTMPPCKIPLYPRRVVLSNSAREATFHRENLIENYPLRIRTTNDV